MFSTIYKAFKHTWKGRNKKSRNPVIMRVGSVYNGSDRQNRKQLDENLSV